MALELTQPPIINLTPNQGTATLGGPTGANLTLGSPNPATDGGVAGFVGDALSATRAALSATFASRLENASYTYNADGTVATETAGGSTTTYTYNADLSVNTVSRNGVTKTYSYNSDGTVSGVA